MSVTLVDQRKVGKMPFTMTPKWVYLFDALDELEAALKPANWEEVRALLGGVGTVPL